MNTAQREYWQHRAEIVPDGLGDAECVFRWHWPRGVLSRRMSAYEIAAFLLPHMPAILPLLGHHPQVQAEFRELLTRLACWPVEVLDELARWVRPVIHEEEDDVIVLDLRSKRPVLAGPTTVVMS